jgi:hypothetical protein
LTVINETELAQLSTLDQVLMWSIVSINAANLDSRNNYVSDSAAIRGESKDFISWSVTQDDDGKGRFVFSALLPMSNPHPFKDKKSIFQRILSYSPFDPTLDGMTQIDGYGWPIPTVFSDFQSTEQILAYTAMVATNVSKWARLTKIPQSEWATIRTEYWGSCQYLITDTPYGGNMLITGYLTIDWNSYLKGRSLLRCLNPYDRIASDLNCNFPDLMLLWNVTTIDPLAPSEEIKFLIPDAGVLLISEDSAEGLIDSYGSRSFIDEAVPDWLQSALDGYGSASNDFNNSSNDIGNATPKIIESLTVCKEQDPSMSSYAISLADKVGIK